MIFALTLCSANYLAHAKALGATLAEHNPDIRFVIGLVDRKPDGLPADFFDGYEVIPVEQLNIPGFSEMLQKYDLVELNTAVKPYYMEHLYRRDAAVEAVIYFDPDIMVFRPLDALKAKLRTFNFIATPHSCTFDDSPINIYYEIGMLSTGIYNLGFLGTARSETTFRFLKWWQHRVKDYCYYEPGSGVFTDQLWVSLAPLYFPGFHTETNPGYNMCYWNHFERTLSRIGKKYVVNGTQDLVFYHFSSFSPVKPDSITVRSRSRVQSFAERPDLKPIYQEYCNCLLSAGYEKVAGLPFLIPRETPSPKGSVKEIVKRGIRSAVGALPKRPKTLLKNVAVFLARDCLRDVK